ncbi:MAG: pyrroline-5-carboxylate reductase [Neisseriales bacterium]|nr:MAG: pyrroline-5-carboxylate reductase [Neisseriales bacterium]
MLKIGFIGVGNMTRAMIAGIRLTQPTWQLSGFDRHPEKLTLMEKQYALMATSTLEALVNTSDYLVVAVKPSAYAAILKTLKTYLKPQQVIITVAAGYPIDRTQNDLGDHAKIVRAMPNTPASIGSAMSAIAFNTHITEAEAAQSRAIFESFGKVIQLDEKYFDIFSAVSGSLPAYICLILEALSDAAVYHGLPREQSYEIISQAIQGSAKWIQDSQEHPAILKDQVCSPGGTTIAAITALEKGCLRNTLINAIDACMDRTRTLQKPST